MGQGCTEARKRKQNIWKRILRETDKDLSTLALLELNTRGALNGTTLFKSYGLTLEECLKLVGAHGKKQATKTTQTSQLTNIFNVSSSA